MKITLRNYRFRLLAAGVCGLLVLFLIIDPFYEPEVGGACAYNLMLVNNAKELWARENGATNGQVIASNPDEIRIVLQAYITASNCFECPALSEPYNYNPVGTQATCPYGKNHVYNPAKPNN